MPQRVLPLLWLQCTWSRPWSSPARAGQVQGPSGWLWLPLTLTLFLAHLLDGCVCLHLVGCTIVLVRALLAQGSHLDILLDHLLLVGHGPMKLLAVLLRAKGSVNMGLYSQVCRMSLTGIKWKSRGDITLASPLNRAAHHGSVSGCLGFGFETDGVFRFALRLGVLDLPARW